MNKIFRILLLIVISVAIIGCEDNVNNPTNTKNTLLEKFEKVSIGMTREEVNAILTIFNEANDSYEEGKISLSFYGTNNTVSSVSVQLSYNNEEVLNSKTNLKKGKKFTDKINNNETVTYEDLVSEFKTEGYCIRKNNDGCRSYAWADSEGRYLNASISSENRISSIFGKV